MAVERGLGGPAETLKASNGRYADPQCSGCDSWRPAAFWKLN